MSVTKLDRLRQMSVTELAYRGRQQASKLVDRLTSSTEPGRRGRARDSRPLSIDGLRHALTTTFFPGARAPETVTLLERRCPELAGATVTVAERLLAGRIDLMGYRDLAMGSPIDWDRDAVSGREAPGVHWSRIDPLDPADVGDSKVTWELNRHQWLVTLAEASRITGNPTFARHAFAALGGWRRSHPYGHGLNWASSLEVAFRLIAWSWLLAMTEVEPGGSPAELESLAVSLREHALHVEKYLSEYFSPNTHLTGEALGLFYAGVLLAEDPHAAAWRALATEILTRESQRQIADDGVYGEQATCYQRYTAEIYLHFLLLAEQAGHPVPTPIRARIERVIDFLITVNQPVAQMPAIGDADGGWVLPLAPRAPADCRGIFAVAAAVFGRPDYAWAAGGLQPEVLWLCGAPGARAFDALGPTPPAAGPSRLFADGGYAVMRSGWGPDARRLIFDVGPLWRGPCRAHGHADLLSVQCAAFGEEFLVDPGTYCYTPEPVWRQHFRSTRAHNTVLVDEADQAEPRGPFGWDRLATGELRVWQTTADADYADAEHRAYGRLADPVRHRRRVLFVRPHYWVLVDDLYGRARHVADLRLQFAQPVTRTPSGWVVARGQTGELWVRSFSRAPLDLRVVAGAIDPIDGWISPDYGQRQAAPVVIQTADALLPLRIATVLIPNALGLRPPTAVTPVTGHQGELTGLRFEDFRSLVRIEDDTLLRETF